MVALFAVFLVIANVGTGGRYQIGVHFKSAAGLHKGALVYESGVIVGIVDQTKLLPEDFTVDVIMAINNSVDIPRDSRFLIAAPLTGDATVEIVPPPPAPRPVGLVGPTPVPQTVALLPRQVLPLEQQPQGTNPATLGDLLEEGQGEVHRLDRMLAQLEDSEPRLLGIAAVGAQQRQRSHVGGQQTALPVDRPLRHADLDRCKSRWTPAARTSST